MTLMLFTALSYAQVGINTNTPDASSALEIESTAGGILIPRMTEIQRDAIVSPASGLMIYQTDQNFGFYFYNGIQWASVGMSGPQGPVGAAGAPGAQGPQGPAGPQGKQGAPGPAGVDGQDGVDGAQGVQGDQGIQGETGTQGPIGPTGSIGTAGAPGAQGPQGDQGLQGIQGETGAQGPQGPSGPQGFAGADGAQGPVGPSGESFQANNAYVVAYSDISSIEGLSDGDLVFDITKQNLYVYTSSSETVSSTYVNFLSTPTSSSTSNTYNVSYIISFQVAKRISIGKIPKSDGSNYASAAPYIFEDNDNINDGFGAKIYHYTSTNEYPDLILSPGKTYRILYIGYSNSFTTRTSNIGNYSFDSSLFLNLQTHKTEDILSSSIPSNYNVEETSTIPYFSGTAANNIFSYHGVSNFILIN